MHSEECYENNSLSCTAPPLDTLPFFPWKIKKNQSRLLNFITEGIPLTIGAISEAAELVNLGLQTGSECILFFKRSYENIFYFNIFFKNYVAKFIQNQDNLEVHIVISFQSHGLTTADSVQEHFHHKLCPPYRHLHHHYLLPCLLNKLEKN